MEESIGYEALFSSDEWESLTFGSWDDPDLDPYDPSSLSGVTLDNGEGCAASCHPVASEGNSQPREVGPGTSAATSLGEVPSGDGMKRGVAPTTTEAVAGAEITAEATCEPDDKSEERSSDESLIALEFVHDVSCRTGDLDDGTIEYVLECDICEEIRTADDYEEADVIAQQHKRATAEVCLAVEGSKPLVDRERKATLLYVPSGI